MPSFMPVFLDHLALNERIACGSLRQIISGGEVLEIELVKRCLKKLNVLLINTYRILRIR